MKHDLVIRNGKILDGSGGAPFVADIAISEGRITAIGTVAESGREEIDAHGMIVTPGFIDVHTHYDGQLTWSPELAPSSSHGVTTVVTGNCGVGFAPCRPQDRARLINLLEGVEDMPEIVLAEGLPWNWESFPEYVAALSASPHDIDFAVQLPHAAVRLYVMGDRAEDGSVASEDDLVRMRALAREAAEAGAIGFGTSRNIFHRSKAGEIIPTAHSHEAELTALAQGMRDGGGGVIQAIFNIEDPKPDFELFRRVALAADAPLSFSLLQTKFDVDEWRDMLDMTGKASLEGPRVNAQIFARPVGMLLGLDASYHPFVAHPGYVAIADLPLADRVAELRKPEVRAAILSEQPGGSADFFVEAVRRFEVIYAMGAPCYEPHPDTSIAALAEARGVSPDEVAYDLLLEDDGHALLFMASANYEHGSLDDVREMLEHPHAVPALGDGGAHYGMICDSTYTTFLLTHWARDREGAKLPLEYIVHLMTGRPAAVLGMHDRGQLAIGMKADLNIIDFDRLVLRKPHVVRDLPSDGRRITQLADGYVATIVSGVVIKRDGASTGALPGRLIMPETLRQRQPELVG